MADPIAADPTIRAISVAIDCTAEQHRLTANNLANLETPGYIAHHASFQDELRSALEAERRGDDGRGLDRVRPRVTPSADAPGPDGNNVCIETEMTELGEASMRYQVLVRLLDRRLEMVGTAIGDGRSR